VSHKYHPKKRWIRLEQTNFNSPSPSHPWVKTIESRFDLTSEKRQSLPLHHIITNFKLYLEDNELNLDEEKRVDLAEKIKTLSQEKMSYYRTSRFGFIKKIFSMLRNLWNTGSFKSSGELGLELAEAFLHLHPIQKETQAKKVISAQDTPSQSVLEDKTQENESIAQKVVQEMRETPLKGIMVDAKSSTQEPPKDKQQQTPYTESTTLETVSQKQDEEQIKKVPEIIPLLPLFPKVSQEKMLETPQKEISALEISEEKSLLKKRLEQSGTPETDYQEESPIPVPLMLEAKSNAQKLPDDEQGQTPYTESTTLEEEKSLLKRRLKQNSPVEIDDEYEEESLIPVPFMLDMKSSPQKSMDGEQGQTPYTESKTLETVSQKQGEEQTKNVSQATPLPPSPEEEMLSTFETVWEHANPADRELVRKVWQMITKGAEVIKWTQISQMNYQLQLKQQISADHLNSFIGNLPEVKIFIREKMKISFEEKGNPNTSSYEQKISFPDGGIFQQPAFLFPNPIGYVRIHTDSKLEDSGTFCVICPTRISFMFLDRDFSHSLQDIAL